jgi:aryl-alcohol dehydrogenase-like predicted oxidoreductase
MPLSLEGRPSEQRAVEVLHAALDAGVTLIDTADVYCLDDRDLGHNEQLVAKALAGRSGDGDCVVATKGGLTRPGGRWERDARPGRLKGACERSLRNLRTDCIDLYQLHAPDPAVPFADSVGALAGLREAGKIRRIGLSNVTVAEIEEARRVVEIASVQNRLNPFFRESMSGGVVNYCLENDIAFIAYSPLGGGRLNKKLSGHPVVESIADRHGTSAHSVVLAWVLARAPNVIAIPGARTVEHALDSAGAAELRLGEEELEEIDAAEFSRA